jgi:ABC-2 type transport system ATP-binding protein
LITMQAPRTNKIAAPPLTSYAIEVEDLVKTYPGNILALRGLSFRVEAGTLFALLGPNGAGKSTTVKILTTLSKPDFGTARIAGVDVIREPQRVRYLIGCVSQKSGSDPNATGRENLKLQGQIYGLSGTDLRCRVDHLLEQFHLATVAHRMVRSYSGGMQRKLDVAMGLIHSPKVLFLDEPTTGLDPESRSEMWDEVGRLATRDGVTVLLTTHYLEEADRLARRLAIVDSGRVVVEGTPEELKGQFCGDSVHIDLLEPAEAGRIYELLANRAISEVSCDGLCIRARTHEGARAVPGMLSALDAGGLRVAAVKVTRPSLDDVYLRHTGQRLRPVHQGMIREESP